MPDVIGVVGISSPENARHSLFYSSLTNVAKPPHTALAHAIGSSISRNRNTIAEQALTAGAEWIWYVDDDQLFPLDTLLKLLARNVSVVSGLYLQRDFPYVPHMYDREEENGAVYPTHLAAGDAGLKSVLATGAGCLLVRTEVLKHLEPPYWRLGQNGGPMGTDQWGDDIDFCRRVRAKGFMTRKPTGRGVFVTFTWMANVSFRKLQNYCRITDRAHMKILRSLNNVWDCLICAKLGHLSRLFYPQIKLHK